VASSPHGLPRSGLKEKGEEGKKEKKEEKEKKKGNSKTQQTEDDYKISRLFSFLVGQCGFEKEEEREGEGEKKKGRKPGKSISFSKFSSSEPCSKCLEKGRKKKKQAPYLAL